MKYILPFVKIAPFLLLLFSLRISAQTTFNDVSLSFGLIDSYHSIMQMGGGVAILDYNNDGWEDFYVTMGDERDQLWRNNGDGTFTERGLSAGILSLGMAESTGVSAGDINNDGFTDLFVTSDGMAPNLFYLNNGDETFTEMAGPAGINATLMSYSGTFGDINKDGFLDLFVVNYMAEAHFVYDTAGTVIGFAHVCNPDFLYLNNGDTTFTEIAVSAGVADSGCGLATTFSDYDRDGDGDLFVINDFGEWVIPNALYQSEFPVTDSFTNVSAAKGANGQMYGMGIAIGDYDHDMDLDYYLTNIGRNLLLNNQGGATGFLDLTTFAQVENDSVGGLLTTGWGTIFVDIDNDKWTDLAVSNGFIPAADIIATQPLDPNKMFRNKGDGTFEDVSDAVGFNSTKVCRGMAWFDYDKDGDPDFIVINENENLSGMEHNLVLRNNLSNSNNYVDFKLRGTVCNRDAFGAMLEIYVGGDSWVSEIDGGSSHLSKNTSIAHFGLGTDTVVDSLVIFWPNGIKETHYNLAANALYQIIEDSTLVIITPTSPETKLKPGHLDVFPNPFSGSLSIEIGISNPGVTQIEIFDLTGRRIQSLGNSYFSPGKYHFKWDGNDFSGNAVTNGMYIVRLQSGSFSTSRRVVLARE